MMDGGGAGVGGERARRKKSPSSLYISVARFADGDDSVELRMDEAAQLCEGKVFLCWIVVENLRSNVWREALRRMSPKQG